MTELFGAQAPPVRQVEEAICCCAVHVEDPSGRWSWHGGQGDAVVCFACPRHSDASHRDPTSLGLLQAGKAEEDR